MLVDVSPEGFFVFGGEDVEVSFGLEKFDNCLFDVREGEKFFYTHLGGVLWSILEVAAIF